MRHEGRILALALLLMTVTAVACTRAPGGSDTPVQGGNVSDAGALVGSRWRLVEAGGQAALPDTGQRGPYLQFESGSRMGGNTTCNSMGGSYTADGSSLRFFDVNSTMMACVEEARMEQERRFMIAIQNTDRYAVQGDTLVLMQGERVVARLVKDY